jgi:hypothetical protein
MNELFQWIFMFMMAMSPPQDPGHYEKGRETVAETTARYEEITNDLIEVIFDEDNKPLFDGPDGRSHTVAVMLAIMFHESKFYRFVDDGEKHGRGDYGKSWCMMQIMAGHHPGKTSSWNIVQDRPPYWGDPEEEIHEGFTGRELVEDRKLCFREGLRMARWSFSRCGNRDLSEKLRVYASGRCRKGGEASRARIYTAESFWMRSRKQRTWTDTDIIAEIKQKFATMMFRQELEKMLQYPTFQLYNPLNNVGNSWNSSYLQSQKLSFLWDD